MEQRLDTNAITFFKFLLGWKRGNRTADDEGFLDDLPLAVNFELLAKTLVLR
jgi:hypothetical protein